MTPSEFKSSFPDGEFNALDGAYVQRFLDKAVSMFNVSLWGDLYSEGLACFVAHSIVLSKDRASRELQVLMAKDTYMRTDYGQRYCELRDMVGLGGTVGE